MVRCVGQRPKEETEALAENTPVRRGLVGNSLTNRAVGFLPTIRSSRPSPLGPDADLWRADAIKGKARSLKQQIKPVFSLGDEPGIGLPAGADRAEPDAARVKTLRPSRAVSANSVAECDAGPAAPPRQTRLGLETPRNSVFSWRQVNPKHPQYCIDVCRAIEKFCFKPPEI
jgi:hypothetical protein